MNYFLAAAGVLLVGVILAYLAYFIRFFTAVRVEQPDWIDREHFGMVRFFSGSLASALDPNVTAAVMQTVFSSRLAALGSPATRTLGRRLRITAIAGLLLAALTLSLLAFAP